MSKVTRRDVLVRGALMTTAGVALAAVESRPQGLVPEEELFGHVSVERWWDEGFYLRGGVTTIDGFEVEHAVNFNDREGWIERWRHIPPRRDPVTDDVDLQRLEGKVRVRFDPELAKKRQALYFKGRLADLRRERNQAAEYLEPEALAKVDEVFAWLERQLQEVWS